MRAAYLLIGLFLGMIFTANLSLNIMTYMTHVFEQEITTYTLVGYQAGYTKGSDTARHLMNWKLQGCIDEVNRVGKRKHR